MGWTVDPKATTEKDIDMYVNDGPGRDRVPAKPETPKPASREMIRLSIDITRDLHRRYKAQCAQREVKMRDDIEAFILGVVDSENPAS